jgi:hypothetical protein
MDQEVPNEGVQCIALHRKGVINKFDAKKKIRKKIQIKEAVPPPWIRLSGQSSPCYLVLSH